MTVKTTGAEFKKFYADTTIWQKGMWHEDEEVSVDRGPTIDGYDSFADTAIVLVNGGVVHNADDEDIGSFESLFRKWRKGQTETILVVTCPIAKRDDVVAAVKAAGGKTI
jgi:hypothetical protein